MPITKKKAKKEDNLRPCKPGETHNPNGRKKGQKNYRTLYREALIKIATAKNMTQDELEVILHESGLLRALKGNYPFYRDVMDRLHGKPPQTLGGYDDKGNIKEQKLEIVFTNNG